MTNAASYIHRAGRKFSVPAGPVFLYRKADNLFPSVPLYDKINQNRQQQKSNAKTWKVNIKRQHSHSRMTQNAYHHSSRQQQTVSENPKRLFVFLHLPGIFPITLPLQRPE